MTDINKVMIALMFMNGYCPFCKEDLAVSRSIDKYRLPDSDVIAKHIKDKKESRRWKSGLATLDYCASGGKS